MKNEMEIVFDAVSENEGFVRVAVAAFVAHLNPTLEELSDIKTAVSEAVTNCIIHGYENVEGCSREEISGRGCHILQGGFGGEEEFDTLQGGERQALGLKADKRCKIRLHCVLEGSILHIEISDTGKGIENVEQAMEPLFTTKPELERSGMGFAFMEAFMDDLEVESTPGQGTTVRMIKKIGLGSWIDSEE